MGYEEKRNEKESLFDTQEKKQTRQSFRLRLNENQLGDEKRKEEEQKRVSSQEQVYQLKCFW